MSEVSNPTRKLRKVLDFYGIRWYDKTVITKKDESNKKMQYEEVHLEKTSFCMNKDQITGFVGYGITDEEKMAWFNYGVIGDPSNYICFKIFTEDHENKYDYVCASLKDITDWISKRLKVKEN